MTRMDDMEDPCQQGTQELLWRTYFVLGVIADSGPCLTCVFAQIVKVEEDPQQKFFLTRSIIACIL